ncbi:hypothetical protein TNCV_773511 [Trichonephila clavipes]|nr:hypothetical protein TNCV_773511 [Trichonephila clavipes]
MGTSIAAFLFSEKLLTLAARHHLIHGPVPVRGPGVADHCIRWHGAPIPKSAVTIGVTNHSRNMILTVRVIIGPATRGLLATDHVILNHGQVMWTTPELAPPSPNYYTTPT